MPVPSALLTVRMLASSVVVIAVLAPSTALYTAPDVTTLVSPLATLVALFSVRFTLDPSAVVVISPFPVIAKLIPPCLFSACPVVLLAPSPVSVMVLLKAPLFPVIVSMALSNCLLLTASVASVPVATPLSGLLFSVTASSLNVMVAPLLPLLILVIPVSVLFKSYVITPSAPDVAVRFVPAAKVSPLDKLTVFDAASPLAL